MTESGAEIALRSARFRAEREAHWMRLDALVGRVEKEGIRSLGFEEARELATGYRQVVNSLSVVRELSLDQALLRYLEALAARAYLVVYAPQETLSGTLSRFLREGIPAAARRSASVIALGFALMMIGAVIGYVLVIQDSSWFYTFVPGDLAGGRTPDATADYLRETLYDGHEVDTNALGAFASYLFSHNTRVAMLIFALGIFYLVPSVWLSIYNGAVLGAMFAIFAAKGLAFDFFAWLSIHGVTELSAIAVACAGGVQLGLAMIAPGRLRRADALRARGPDALCLLALAALMLIAAAILEGFFRQLVNSAELRLIIGWGIGVLWLVWLSGKRFGRRAT